MTAGAGRTTVWTSFNIPNQITSQTPNGAKTAQFWYNPEHERIKELQADQSIVIVLSPRYDTGLHFEKKYIAANNALTGAVEYEHYLYAGGMMFGKYITVTQTDGVTVASTSLEYYSKDNLGSIVAITDGTGAVTQRLSYDPWGKRRYPNGTADPNGLLNNPDMYHGYTGHEMLDDVGLIHMNGRLYDPVTARFLSADPHIQDPLNLQSYNRYSYCWGNPMVCTDPSGYFSLGRLFRAAVVIAAAYYAPGLTQSLFSSMAGSAAASAAAAGATLTTMQVSAMYIASGAIVGAGIGFTTSFVASGGDFNAAVNGMGYGALSGGLFTGAGMAGTGPGSFARYAAHGGAGCVSGAVSGGGCGRGALSAISGKWASNLQGNVIVAMMAGGTVSAIGGGKFANGAVTAAYGYAFNAAMARGGAAAAAGGMLAGGAGSSGQTGATGTELDSYLSEGKKVSWSDKFTNWILNVNEAGKPYSEGEARGRGWVPWNEIPGGVPYNRPSDPPGDPRVPQGWVKPAGGGSAGNPGGWTDGAEIPTK